MDAQDISKMFRTVNEVAEYYDVSPRAIRARCQRGTLDAVKVGSEPHTIWLIRVDEDGQPVRKVGD